MKRLLLLALAWSAIAVADVPVPPLKARVTDLTATLSTQQGAELEQALADFERRKGAQLAVLIVPTTQPETVEQYAVRVEEAWKLGRKGVDDGVLLLVAKNDRRLRIEVGYGLEGVLPDVIAKRIIEEDITPHFKQGDFYGGIRAGAERIMRVVEGEKLPPPAAATSLGTNFLQSMLESAAGFVPVVAMGLAFFLMGAARELLGRALGSLVAGSIIGGIAWLMSGLVGVGIAVGLIAVVLSVIDAMPTKRSRGSDMWSSSGRGTSSGGGGFSGGGGGSGGGGSSGSW